MAAALGAPIFTSTSYGELHPATSRPLLPLLPRHSSPPAPSLHRSSFTFPFPRPHPLPVSMSSDTPSRIRARRDPHNRPPLSSIIQYTLLPALSDTTPLLAVKWTAIGAITLSILRAVFRFLSEPSVWMYASWFFVIWPGPAAVVLGIWALVAAAKQSKKKAKEWEQVVVLGGALTWLILVPLGLFHGYVDGWPLTLFFLYMFFFLMSAVIRLRRFGELSPRSEDKQWASTPSRIAQIAFIVAVVGGHWFAAYQAPHLFYTWNWQWPSRIATALFVLAVVVHYNATYFLGKYFDRLVKPMAVVVFGPYRWARHPIYASYMLLFAGYCVALRAYWSMAFLLIACLLYYEQRVKLEEDMLVEAFGEQYISYRDKVRAKYFPFLY